MVEHLEEAQQNLDIKDVILKSSVVAVRHDVDVLTTKFEDSVTQFMSERGDIDEMEVEETEGQERFWVYKFSFRAGVRLVATNETEDIESEFYEPLVHIVATFESRYFSAKQISDDAAKAFSINNAGFNIWPYWRELVQSTCARMGMQHCIQVPLFRLTKNT